MTHTIVRPGMRRSNDDFNRLFGEFFHKPMHQIVQEIKNVPSPVYANISQNDQSFDIKLAIPGYNKADVSITLDENKLIVKGSKSADENVKYLKKEFNFNSFERVFTLPENVKTDQIEAITNDGILHIIVPKTEVKAPVNISVK